MSLPVSYIYIEREFCIKMFQNKIESRGANKLYIGEIKKKTQLQIKNGHNNILGPALCVNQDQAILTREGIPN